MAWVRAHDYHTHGYHLLCNAHRAMVQMRETFGWDCFIVTETYTKMQFTVYYMAYKDLSKQRTAWQRHNDNLI